MAAAVRIEAIDRALEHMFRRVLHDVTGEPPQLDSVRITRDEHRDAISIRARFKVQGQQDRFIEHSISRHELMSQRESINVGRTLYNADIIWSRCYEDHYIRRMQDAAFAGVREAYSVGQFDRAQHIERMTRELTDHARRNHSSTATEVRFRQEQYSINEGIALADRMAPVVRDVQRRIAEQIERELVALMGTTTTTATADSTAPALTAETILEAMRALERNNATDGWRRAFREPQEVGPQVREVRTLQDYYDGLSDLIMYGSAAWLMPNIEVGTPEAQARGLQLLKDNLTPEQRESYEKNKCFDVRGGESGTTYRIRHGRQMNIEVLNGKGKRDHGLCFLPVGGLVSGDVMLAQKTALELYESEALKIANRFG